MRFKLAHLLYTSSGRGRRKVPRFGNTSNKYFSEELGGLIFVFI